MALTTAKEESMFLRQLMVVLHQESSSAAIIHEEPCCTHQEQHGKWPEQTHGREDDIHFCHDKVESEDVEVRRCAIESMLADVLT
jgi:hypothetical protein